MPLSSSEVSSTHCPPAWLWPRAAYIHIPFCAHHCGYCDFAVAAGQDHLIDQYLDALSAELALLEKPQEVRTVFLGGGTPTHLHPQQLERLLREIRRWFLLEPNYEFTVEANPDDLNVERIQVLANHGVNRVSLGAQSFHAHLLKTLERRHQAEQVPQALERVRSRIAHVSLDLIFGVPGQTLSEWEADLARALALHPDHLSTYGLTFEKGTRLWKQRERGEVIPLHEELELAMYLHAMDALEEAGFEHYEISNFAKPGCRSRHNQVYWANEAYFGVGVGAARYINGKRELNTRDVVAYIQRALAGEATTFQSEVLPAEERARETMAVQLRRAEGINRRRFHEQTGWELDDLAGTVLARHVDLEYLEDDRVGVRLTRKGKCVADSVIRNLL